jgi:hypothetical protein
MTDELQRLLCLLLDTNNINIRERYIMSVANVWADKLNRNFDSDDMRLDPVLFAKFDMRFGQHSIDRFALALNTLLPRYNTGWKDPTCEAVDALHLPDNAQRKQLVQPSMAPTTQPRPKTTTQRRNGHNSRP